MTSSWKFYTFKVTLRYDSSGEEVVRTLQVPAYNAVEAAAEVSRTYKGEHYEVVKVEWEEG